MGREAQHIYCKPAVDLLNLLQVGVATASHDAISQLPILPSKIRVADSILIFVCKPDDAEAIVGDLIEDYQKVLSRHPRLLSDIWFTWELTLVVLGRVRSRLARAVVPSTILDAITKRILS